MAEKSIGRDIGAWPAMSDRALVEELRSARGEAVDEFLRRFEPLVTRHARRLRIPPAERVDWVIDLLYDVAITIVRGHAAAPRHLGAYVGGACRRRVREQMTKDAAYRAGVHDALEEIEGAAQMTVAGLCSENALRAARDPEWEPPPLSPVLVRLVSAIEEGITDEEHLMLRWLAAQISYTMIAGWLGISRPAAVSRIQRLRARLIESALRFGTALDSVDRAEFMRFLRRTGAIDDQRILALRNRSSSKEDPDE